MPRTQLRKLGTHWPTIFTVGVALYFLFSALNVTERIPTFTRSNDVTDHVEPTPVTTVAKASPVAAGQIDVRVTSFRLDPNDDARGATANLTLEVHNETKGNITFYADQLRFREVGADTGATPKGEKPRVEVSPHLGVLVPVAFQVRSAQIGRYELLYQGHRVYSGGPAL